MYGPPAIKTWCLLRACLLLFLLLPGAPGAAEERPAATVARPGAAGPWSSAAAGWSTDAAGWSPDAAGWSTDAAAVLSDPAHGSGEAPDRFSLFYHQENDGPWPNPFNGTDRYYTHGIAVGVTHQPEWARALSELLPFGDERVRSGAGYIFAHEMYTPEDLTSADLITGDRPYAGNAYLGVAHYRASRWTLDRLQVDIGAVGPVTRAGEIQRFAHENWGGKEPRGWDNQIRNEPTLQLGIERKWRLEAGEPFGAELLPAASIDYGSAVRQGRLDATVRVGFNLPDDYGEPRFGSPREATALPRRGLGVFVTGGVAGRAVAHSKLISGNRGVDGPGREVERFVGELSYGGGVVLRVGSWSIEAHYSQIVVSPEFEGQRRAHRFGSAFFAIGGPSGK